ncbi:MAG: hypothetical protein ABIQ16_16215 [Polyangiaceae bacterium]
MADKSQALLFASQFELWRRTSVKGPVYIPQRFAHLAPAPAAEIAHGMRDLHSRARHAGPTLQNMEHLKVAGKLPRAALCFEAPPQKVEPYGAIAREPVIDFDHDTWITDVQQSATFQVDEQVLPPFFAACSPENWARNAGDGSFYKGSDPGVWQGGTFHPLEDLSNCAQKWQSGEITQLREHVEWSTNANAPPSSVIAMLTIANYDLKRHSFSFDFVLHHCLEYNFGTACPPDIMDVDDGHFEATFDPSQGSNLLTVTCSKRLHFNAARSYDLDLAAMLNMFSPALVSLLMRELVFDGTIKILDDVTKKP